MCLIIFEETAEIQDQHPLSLNRDRDRLKKYWANYIYIFHFFRKLFPGSTFSELHQAYFFIDTVHLVLVDIKIVESLILMDIFKTRKNIRMWKPHNDGKFPTDQIFHDYEDVL